MATSNRKVVITLDTYLSILAVVSSFCAIGITFYQAYLQRTQQYASVMPVLEIYNTSRLEDIGGYALLVTNDGLGPAFIEEASFQYKGKNYGSVGELAYAILKQANVNDTTRMISDLWKGRVIPQGEKVPLINTPNKQIERLIREGLNNVKIEILYKSAYGETWQLTFPSVNNVGRNVKVE